MLKKIIIVVFISFLSVFAYVQINKYLEQKEVARIKSAEQFRLAEAKRKGPIRNRFDIPRPGVIFDGKPNELPAPVPEWQKQQADFYHSRLMQDGGYTALVVPFQQAGPFENTPARLYDAESLAELLRNNGEKVPTVEMVRNILGRHMREYNDYDVYQLANALGVKSIYWGFAGFSMNMIPSNKTYAVNYKIIRQTAPAGHRWALGEDFAETPVDCSKTHASDTPPEMITLFQGCLADIRKDFAIAANFKKTVYPPTKLSMNLPAAEMLKNISAENAMDNAMILHFMAMLVPRYSPYIKMDLMVRSLIALNDVDPSSDNYKLLLARNYFYLGMRPLAIQTLATPTTPAEKSFLELVNGNLDGLKEIVATIEDPILRTCAEIEYIDLDYKYFEQIRKPEIERITTLYPAWNFEIFRRLQDQNLWSQHDNIKLKQLLDLYYPIPGISLPELMVGMNNHMSNSGDMLDLQLAFQQHIDTLRKNIFSSPSIPNKYPGSVELDYISLLEAIGQSNLFRLVLYYTNVQGQPENAERLLAVLEKFYRGHPELLHVKMSVLNSLKNKSGNRDLSATDRDLGMLYVQNNFFYEPYSESFLYDVKAYTDDREYLMNHYDITPFIKHFASAIDKGQIDETLKREISERFNGNPKKIDLEILLANRTGDYKAQEELYQKSIERHPDYWEHINEYGLMLLNQGRYEKAEDVYKKYKPFSDSNTGVNRVTLSHAAYWVGNAFFWRGEFERSRLFYRIAADLDTGSSGSNMSAGKLALLDGLYDKAVEIFHRNGTQYRHSYAFASAFSLMHAMGQTGVSDQMEDDAIRKLQVPALLRAKLVGMRINHADIDSSCRWLSNMQALEPSMSKNGSSAFFIYQLTHIDRISSNPPCKQVAINDATPEKFSQKKSNPSANIGQLAAGDESSIHYNEFISDFAIANEVLHNPDAAGIKEAIERTKVFCDAMSIKQSLKISGIWYCNLQHYLALSEAEKNHNIEGKPLDYWISEAAEKELINFHTPPEEDLGHASPDNNRYVASVKRSIAAMVLGNHDKAIAFLQDGFNSIPNSMDYEYPQSFYYELLTFSEYFYVRSSDERYRKLIVDWSRKSQKMEPWNAWSYAFEAKYTDVKTDKLRALAIGLYLDKDSDHLSGFSQEERDQAKIWLSNNNPFLIPNTKSTTANMQL